MPPTRKPRLTTTQRGLGWKDHQRFRPMLLAALKDGDPCARCASRGIYHPMFRSLPPRLLEVDDFPSRAVALPLGIKPVKMLSYRACNRHAGGVLGNKIKKARREALGLTGKPSQYTRW